MILRRVFVLLHAGLQKFDSGSDSYIDWEGPVSTALSHGGRVNMRIPKLKKGQTGTELTDWLGITQGGNTATVSAGGALKVDGSAVTQPVSGTLTAVEKTACGSTTYDSGMVTMPNTSTAVTSTATCEIGRASCRERV